MKRLIASLLMITGFVLVTSVEVTAEETIAETCGLPELPEENPNLQTVNCLLTETALKYDVPPEIVKAVAEEENGDWKHFDADGEPIVSSDGGIGLMQVTNKPLFDEDRLKHDLPYNIEAGVKTLNDMFQRKDLPSINGQKRNIIEHWYFAVMAYNGIKPVNSPIDRDGHFNEAAYQERVFQNIDDYSGITPVSLSFSKEDFEYDRESSDNITFNTMTYTFQLPFTKTRHHLEQGNQVEILNDTRLREHPTVSSPQITTLSNGEKVTITGPFEYDQNEDRKNHFIWYPVETSKGEKGYMTSMYLTFSFSDLSDDHYANDEIYYLYDRSIINGIPGGQFGMGDPLTRWQAVLLILRANYTEIGDRPDPGFPDVPKDYTYYDEIAAAVDEGLFEGTKKGEFRPNATLTRAEMAVVLQRLYNFPDTNKKSPFTDIPETWYTNEVNRLYHAGITNGYGSETTFAPSAIVSREQFAVFMTRSIAEEYRIQ